MKECLHKENKAARPKEKKKTENYKWLSLQLTSSRAFAGLALAQASPNSVHRIYWWNTKLKGKTTIYAETIRSNWTAGLNHAW